MSEIVGTTSDEELARQTQAGSFEAFEELVRRFERRIFTFVTRTCGPPADAAEITQATFVKAFQSIRRFDCRYTFAAWLFTIARRKCIDDYRAARPPTNAPMPEQFDLEDPAELLAHKEDCKNLWDLIRLHLSAVQFQALWLRYAEEMDVPEIARVLGKTRIYTKVILFRARQTLATEFGERRFLTDLSLTDAPSAKAEQLGNSPAEAVAGRSSFSRAPTRPEENPGVQFRGRGPVPAFALVGSKRSL
jgi:RNA polymerase sigma-70 factor (ECF subfamily)